VIFNPNAPEEEKYKLLPGCIIIGIITGLNAVVSEICVSSVLPPFRLMPVFAADDIAVVVVAG
jgi:hypothetical protein